MNIFKIYIDMYPITMWVESEKDKQ